MHQASLSSQSRALCITLALVGACGSGTVGSEATGVNNAPPEPPGGNGSGGSTSSGAGGSSNGAGGSATAGPSGAEQQCVDLINTYRATLGLAPYARWTVEEACASTEAASDSESGTAHGAFPRCTENAQNECPGYSGSYASMLPKCLDLMWKEGPGADFSTHGHYINMSSTKYSKVACGFATTSAGKIWSVQDFR